MNLNTCSGLLAAIILSLFVVAVAATAPGVSADDDDDLSAPAKGQLTYPNLGSHLSGMVEACERGPASQSESTESVAVSQGESVAVTIHLTANVAEVSQFLWENGGDPRNVGEDYIEAYVPVFLLGRLSEQAGVIRVREIIPPKPEFGPITSQGVEAHLATAWHNAGYNGQGVKVGIIDTGFNGYSALMGVELSDNVVARCYTSTGVFTSDLADCEAEAQAPASFPSQCIGYFDGADPHGTAVAEAVIDIAPDATLYIANPGSWADLKATTEWMAGQGVSTINHSVAWYFTGPGDGTSNFSTDTPLDTVDQAVARGVTWVNAAGNSGEDTWSGRYIDPDNDSILAFSDLNDESMDIRYLECRPFTVQLRWEDTWGGADTDLDIALYDHSAGGLLEIGGSNIGSGDDQTGEIGHIPFEVFSHRPLSTRNDISIIVIHHSGPVPQWIQMTIWGATTIQHRSDAYSISNPAESSNRGMLAVGASHYWNTNTIADYSSRGPTRDGRIKPDIVGTACAQADSYDRRDPRFYGGNNCWFAGTSQAAPHVAGMAALVKQANPSFTPEQVADYLKNKASDRGPSGTDNIWGYGFAVLPSPNLRNHPFLRRCRPHRHLCASAPPSPYRPPSPTRSPALLWTTSASDKGTASNLSGSADAYTFDVTPNDIGQVTVDIAADAVHRTWPATGTRQLCSCPWEFRMTITATARLSLSEVLAAVDDYLFPKFEWPHLGPRVRRSSDLYLFS